MANILDAITPVKGGESLHTINPDGDGPLITDLYRPGERRRESSPLAKEYRRRLATIQDMRDWGPEYDGHPIYDRTTERWNAYVTGEWRALGGPAWQYRPPVLWAPRLHARLTRTSKVYITGHGTGPLGILMPDADAHNGETDAAEALAWAMDTYWPDGYREGADRGGHGYVIYDRGELPDPELYDLLNQANAAVGLLGEKKGFAAKLELKGRPSCFDRRGRIVKRGGLFAAPHLGNSWDHLDQFFGQAVSDLSPIRQLVTDARPLVAVPRHVENPPNSDCPKGAREEGITVCVPTPVGWASHRDAFFATRLMRQELAHRLGRLPTDDEANHEYDQHRPRETSLKGLRDRRRRIRNAGRFMERTFDPSKMNRAGYAANRERLEALVAAKCVPNVVDGVGHSFGPNVVGKLAVMLHTVETNCGTKHSDPNLQDTSGKHAFLNMSRVLEAEGAPLLRGNDIRPGKEVLSVAGLVEVADGGEYRKGGRGKKGVSMKLTLGPAHPLYLQFQQRRKDHGIVTRTLAEIEEIEAGDEQRAVPAAVAG